MYLIKEFQRLKTQESHSNKLDWNIKRSLTKINYRIHTDAIKTHLIPLELAANKINYVYANEADLLNLALFGKAAKQWREENPDLDGNIRDYASAEQLLVLASLESQNALLMEQKISHEERLVILNKLAITQMKSLTNNPSAKKLIGGSLLGD